MRAYLFSAVVVAVSSALAACSGSTASPELAADASATEPGDGGTSGPGPSDSSTSSDGSHSKDASTSSDSSTPPSEAGTTCNTIEQQGTAFSILATDDPMPVPMGGILTNGTWVATSGQFWAEGVPAGSPGNSDVGALTLEVNGSTLQSVQKTKTGKVERTTMNVTTTGTKLTLTPTCTWPESGGTGAGTIDYTATPTSFSFIASNAGVTVELVFTKM